MANAGQPDALFPSTVAFHGSEDAMDKPCYANLTMCINIRSSIRRRRPRPRTMPMSDDDVKSALKHAGTVRKKMNHEDVRSTLKSDLLEHFGYGTFMIISITELHGGCKDEGDLSKGFGLKYKVRFGMRGPPHVHVVEHFQVYGPSAPQELLDRFQKSLNSPVITADVNWETCSADTPEPHDRGTVNIVFLTTSLLVASVCVVLHIRRARKKERWV
eukprot:gnl/TRDRNA2_/TRDRNA2_143087_c0_seq2.p1 gnl/TRDRNA2_/TRDRNA2_143087_c0~~gnl/TRDRNA2_/TRDRNA2_143087_c0_seq2.p1  ORF type:complete len:216 (-),score=28.50 gnl/TRDRNA2_/TRDRNA2_143087_c0_seq2:364-1011(-)